MILDNTNLKRFYYISNILDSSWLSSVSIESMGEILLSQKMIIALSIGKHEWVSKGLSNQDFTNIIHNLS